MQKMHHVVQLVSELRSTQQQVQHAKQLQKIAAERKRQNSYIIPPRAVSRDEILSQCSTHHR